MQIVTASLHWMDEGQPQVGSGVRRCHVKWGRKWVHVREAHGVGMTWKRIPRAQFEGMFPLCAKPEETSE